MAFSIAPLACEKRALNKEGCLGIAVLEKNVEKNPECHFLVWTLVAFLGLALVISLLFNISHYVEKHRQDKIYSYANDYIPRDDEYYIEDTPIYGNLEDVVPVPTDENCYEQMKSQPQRSMNKLQEATPYVQTPAETQMCYASLDISYKGKLRKPRTQNPVSLKGEDKQFLSKTSLVDDPSPESQAEENIHDDPIRLFGLLRAKTEPVNQLDCAH
ncbi:T-cell receptor-associated transmembrane adapter 1 [Echinops telfairi]|uniref:T-cell receptor-associated transmembrane adapter 1 n=1 Tax=Echinops telfairi TaxID=9371 RepID=UPI000333D12A|nr:T-cell receptor-associated transmembrane adapter 1 [Echinops telfairi]